MTTRAWTFPISQSNDANFRAWISDFSAKLAEVGLVQNADTGQIDLLTVTRPSTTETAAGYQIWRFPDSSVFIKIEYGTSNGTQMPQVWLRVGRGSDGAGNLTGAQSSRLSCGGSNVGQTLSAPGTNRPSYMSFSPDKGFFGVAAYVGGTTTDTSTFGFLIARSTDANGNLNSTGMTIYCPQNNLGQPADVQAVDFQTGVASAVNTKGQYGFVPMGLASSAVGPDFQAFVNWSAFPRVSPVMQVVTVLSSEFNTTTGFSATVVGATPSNYMTLDGGMHGDGMANGTPGIATSTPLARLAILWE